MLEIRFVLTWLSTQRQALFDRTDPDNDRGDIISNIIFIGLLAAAAIVVGAILVGKATTAANNVKTQ